MCCFPFSIIQLAYSSHVWMWELDRKEGWAPKNRCFWIVVLEKTLESPLDCKEIQLGWRKHKLESRLPGEISITSDMQIIASWLRAGGEGDDRGWDGWMTSPTQWTWVWVDSGSWWSIGKPGVLWFMGLQSRTWLSNWIELNWTEPLSVFILQPALTTSCCEPVSFPFLLISWRH